MPTSTRNLTLDFMQTEKGQFSSFKLNAILGLKYNHENKYSHNFLVQFQNIKTNFVETVEVSPELLRYRFKLGNTYKEGMLVSKGENEYEKYLEINTQKMKVQEPIYKVLSKEAIIEILGDNDFNAFKYGGNFCYIHEEEDERYIIPSSVVALYYYFRSSSMKEAIYKGNPFILHDSLNSNLMDKTDAILVLESHASKLDGPFIYRFLTSETAQKGFIDFSRYISAFKNKKDMDKKTTGLIPIKALFPTRETFNIKIRYIEIKNASIDKKTYLVNEIKNDDSTLDFEKLTVLKKKKRDTGVDPEDESGLHIKRRKPKKRRKNVNTKTPSSIYGTNKIREIENTQNLSLEGKDITYGSLEEENSNVSLSIEKEEKGNVSVTFSKGENSGDETAQQSKLETEDNNKEKMPKPPTFDIFVESIEFIEDSNLVSEFLFNNKPKEVPANFTKNKKLTTICSIHNRPKQYVTCSFEYNDINVVLIEVESEHNDFATWVISSKNEIIEDEITEVLKMRYSELNVLDTIKERYNDLNTLKFFTYRHAQINDENEHEEVLERWLLRLFNKIK
ncbi:hypothetical protein B0F89_10757 [Malaciobacter marinus]|jgi:hypothetical protein|uniref:TnsE C-terminal domain-containing protein n=1 Tax=Malaciobacter marinus TaxID=505249 RepID=A0AB36ZXK5_9BACT|nr:hypothetical protein [Malaciobacter marinus]PPK61821.1 hypothetical protein B0F89_10757 [Malaciobacter marinus]